MFVAAIPILTVYFNATPIPCVVDTGSMLMLVSAAQTVTIPELSELAEPVRIQTATGEVLELERRQVAHVATGDLHWSDVQVVIVPEGQALIVDCILGLDVLSRQPLTIDWQRRAIVAAAEWRPDFAEKEHQTLDCYR